MSRFARTYRFGVRIPRIGAVLALGVAASLLASTLLAAQPLPQAQATDAASRHKQTTIDHNGAAKCEPQVLRGALSAHHVMPDVRACTYQAVAPYFKEFGGHAATPRNEASSLTSGVITRQVPGAGVALAAGEPVTLYVSSGAPPPLAGMLTPRVTGRAEADALDVLHRVGLRNLSFQSGRSELAKGTVYMQSPEPDVEVTAGTPVRLGISQGPSTIAASLGGPVPSAGAPAPAPTGSSNPSGGGDERGGDTLPLIASVFGGVLVLGGGWMLRHRLRLARTRRLLKLRPARGPGEAMQWTVAPAFNAPTVTLRSRLDDGDARFRNGLPILHVEIRHE